MKSKWPLRYVMFGLVLILVLSIGCESLAASPEPPHTLGQPFTLDYPRLGMWWPDPWEQSLDDIARYDWVILWNDAGQFIPDLRVRNPNIVLLNATNACELSYTPGSGLEPWEIEQNQEVIDLPPEWFLTQVGTELTQAVDATATRLHVATVIASEGEETYDLFVPGDTALIEGESVYIEAVDTRNKTLTVQRGYVRPASPHDAGTRVAAHITFWPDSWMLNVSTLSPRATVSATLGPEIWPDYNARRAVALVNSADWDGILLDRSDPDESWIIGNSTARTIDPDQSNTLLTDYSAFDATWNEGVRRYEQALRDAVGPDKIIFVNWGMANYDLLNGNNFEGFPMDNGTAYGTPWPATVFGSLDDGSYFEWMARAQPPNLTMVETYEDDEGADPWGDGGYDNPCDDPNFTPNYRKMRLGLATALLNDGFFSYEINTNGHGALCLLWFDEYDGGPQIGERGYLGQPLGPAYRALPPLATPNLLGEGSFEQGLGNWDVWADTDAGYSATATLDTTTAAEGQASARVDVVQSQGTDWQAEFSKAPVDIASDEEYTLSFWAKADHTWELEVAVQQNQAPWKSYIVLENIVLTTDWQHYELSGIAKGSNSEAVLHFEVGAHTGSVWFDDARFQMGGHDVWRRDYVNGTALVNATSNAQTVPLGGLYRKLQGTQAPEVNDGSLVNHVVLPSLDGIIVLRVKHLYLPVVLRM